MSRTSATATPDRLPPSFVAVWAGVGFSFAFTVLIWLADWHWLITPPLTPDRPGFWYEWQLLEPTVWSRLTAWVGYLLHQVTIWYLIWQAQRERPAYTAGLHRFNVQALAANALFIVLHLVQTQIWYDGLAQDVHEATAQWSVIVLLVAVLVIENRRRGMVFGYRMGFVEESADVIRRYHGYYFAWAAIYTFWYHPMIGLSGHLMGFLYMFLLLLQGSLFFTRAHTNRYWMVTQEIAVAVHGAMVAWMQAQGWEMFLCGFLGVFVITQMHGLGLSTRWRWAIGLGYIGLVAGLYDGQWAKAPAILGIPATILAGALGLSVIVIGLLRLARRLTPLATAASRT
jgi:hypothetical protein